MRLINRQADPLYLAILPLRDLLLFLTNDFEWEVPPHLHNEFPRIIHPTESCPDVLLPDMPPGKRIWHVVLFCFWAISII